MFIIGFCHTESITVLFYGIAVDICGVSVKGNQSVRIRAFFLTHLPDIQYIDPWHTWTAASHFFIYIEDSVTMLQGTVSRSEGFYSGRYGRIGKEK